ncbi:MAG: hypothetical protein EP329_14260 [Deltaproteobacteria bacterium]|nr:MAG: hypothetical protein EP329_14260 [Deltaproteobacteria bacterium]
MSPASPITTPLADRPIEETARQLVTTFAGEPQGLLNFLVSQVSAVRQQAQTMLGLCGLIITVTGFSGPRMAESSSLSAWAMVSGIALTLVGAIISLAVLIQIRWVSDQLDGDLVATAARILRRRDSQHRRTTVAGAFVAAGLAAYLLSVAVTAFASATAG